MKFTLLPYLSLLLFYSKCFQLEASPTCFTNANDIGLGFSIYQGYPLCLTSSPCPTSNRQGFRNRALKLICTKEDVAATCMSNRLFNEGTSVECQNSVFVDKSGKMMRLKTLSDLKLILDRPIRVFNQNFHRDYEFGMSNEILPIKQRLANYSDIVFYTFTEITNMKFTINDNQIERHPEFIADKNRIQKFPGDPAPYFELIIKYGTHYINGVTIGGRIEAYISVRQSCVETFDNNFDFPENYAQIYYEINVFGQTNQTNYDQAKFQEFSSCITKFYYQIIGGKTNPSNIEQWANSVEALSKPIGYQLEPIEFLFPANAAPFPEIIESFLSLKKQFNE